ncbi:hypothetical protein HEPPS_05940 [Candidatus Hepatoplasma crinochetorum]|uniref:Uncharacterized protein n=1 Tax=Candidatus Hepatoplasma crinochetorum TaxID=295596 RepID=A0A0G7ZNM4_9MOLU|nr:hypothetical protein HEPPS_05940 [Candidatus Hepatoplasma crinochetorum]
MVLISIVEFNIAVGEPTKLAIVTSKPIEPSFPPLTVTLIGVTFEKVAIGSVGKGQFVHVDNDSIFVWIEIIISFKSEIIAFKLLKFSWLFLFTSCCVVPPSVIASSVGISEVFSLRILFIFVFKLINSVFKVLMDVLLFLFTISCIVPPSATGSLVSIAEVSHIDTSLLIRSLNSSFKLSIFVFKLPVSIFKVLISVFKLIISAFKVLIDVLLFLFTISCIVPPSATGSLVSIIEVSNVDIPLLIRSSTSSFKVSMASLLASFTSCWFTPPSLLESTVLTVEVFPAGTPLLIRSSTSSFKVSIADLLFLFTISCVVPPSLLEFVVLIVEVVIPSQSQPESQSQSIQSIFSLISLISELTLIISEFNVKILSLLASFTSFWFGPPSKKLSTVDTFSVLVFIS